MFSFCRFLCSSVYGSQCNFLVVGESNVAIGKTATGNFRWYPEDAIDGDLTTVAASGQTGYDKWLTIDLQATHYISRVVIYNGGDGKSCTAVWMGCTLRSFMQGRCICLPCNTRILHNSVSLIRTRWFMHFPCKIKTEFTPLDWRLWFKSNFHVSAEHTDASVLGR